MRITWRDHTEHSNLERASPACKDPIETLYSFSMTFQNLNDDAKVKGERNGKTESKRRKNRTRNIKTQKRE